MTAPAPPPPGIGVHALGAADPFSKSGQSSAYWVRAGDSTLLIDAGAPLFELLTYPELAALDGVFVTHIHADHHRWLSDLAVFRRYNCRDAGPVKVFATETLHAQLRAVLGPILMTSLSIDRDRIVDLPYEAFIEPVVVGPRARFRIAQAGGVPRVVDAEGRPVPASDAKVVQTPLGGEPRLLMRDPASGAWVEPAVYYASDDPAFYDGDPRQGVPVGEGLTLRAVADHGWHGVPIAGAVVESTDGEMVGFSGDTAFDPELFRRLADARPNASACADPAFADAHFLRGNINDFLQRIWSERRFAAALDAFAGMTVFHDTAAAGSVVHTDYTAIGALSGSVVHVHVPDRFAALRPIARGGRRYQIVGGRLLEPVNGSLHEVTGDVFICEGDRYFIGTADPNGDMVVGRKPNGVLDVERADAHRSPDLTEIFRATLVEDIGGRHFPRPAPDERYVERPDGRIERVTVSTTGSFGTVVTPLPRPAVDPAALQRTRPAAAPGTANGAGDGRRADTERRSDTGHRHRTDSHSRA
jgi:hypothetical protein